MSNDRQYVYGFSPQGITTQICSSGVLYLELCASGVLYLELCFRCALFGIMCDMLRCMWPWCCKAQLTTHLPTTYTIHSSKKTDRAKGSSSEVGRLGSRRGVRVHTGSATPFPRSHQTRQELTRKLTHTFNTLYNSISLKPHSQGLQPSFCGLQYQQCGTLS